MSGKFSSLRRKERNVTSRVEPKSFSKKVLSYRSAAVKKGAIIGEADRQKISL